MNLRIFSALMKGIVSYLLLVFVFGIAFFFTKSLNYYGNPLSSNISFFDYMYFSLVTFSTIGYGEIIPTGMVGKLIVLIESCIGLAFIPTLGGYLAYLFIQRPKDFYLSENIFIRNINNKVFLSARIGNKGKPIIDCDASIEMFQIENNLKRTIFKHVFSKPMVEISWYLNLKMDDAENSQSLQQFKEVLNNPTNSAIRITFKGHDSRSGNMVHLFKIYTVHDFKKGGKFLDIYTWNGITRNVNSWHNFNKTEPLNQEQEKQIEALLSK